jgi:DNA replication protein DnaC
MVSKAQGMALAAGDGWLDQGANILLFGPPDGGKSHFAARSVWLSFRTAGARCSCARPTSSSGSRCLPRLEAAITELDKYQLLILDDIAYVTKDQAETSVLFRVDRRSL